MTHNVDLRPTKAPNLPIASYEYAPYYQDQLNNVLRLYFAQLDNFSSAITGSDGGAYIQNPHIAASDTTNQYATGNDIPTKVKWNTLDTGSGFTLNVDNTATAHHRGVYKIDYSLQFANTDNAQNNVFVWLEVTNGGTTQVTNSSSDFTLVARKSVGVSSYLVAYSSITFEIHAGDIISLWWATSTAYNPVGPVNGIFMEALPAQTTPYARPANPSAVGVIIFVSTT